jgi:15-cis-phytoene synthase
VTSPTASDARIREAYRHCETVTRQQAKNFAYGITLLPADKRRALSAVYALARRIDDIGDGTLPAERKLEELAAARKLVALLADGHAAEAAPDDFVLLALTDAAHRFPLPVDAFGELIDGCEADVRGTRYAGFSELEHYCRCVAGSIGRLSLGVFGSRDPAAATPLADALGIALQLTNILRDVKEDLGNGRVYLPAADLARFGCTLQPAGQDDTGGPGTIGGPMAELMRFEADRARTWYATGMQLMPLLDRRSAACTGAMAGIYRRLLEHISARPDEALQRRLSLPTREKAAIAVGALAGKGRRSPGRRTPGVPPSTVGAEPPASTVSAEPPAGTVSAEPPAGIVSAEPPAAPAQDRT